MSSDPQVLATAGKDETQRIALAVLCMSKLSREIDVIWAEGKVSRARPMRRARPPKVPAYQMPKEQEDLRFFSPGAHTSPFTRAPLQLVIRATDAPNRQADMICEIPASKSLACVRRTLLPVQIIRAAAHRPVREALRTSTFFPSHPPPLPLPLPRAQHTQASSRGTSALPLPPGPCRGASPASARTGAPGPVPGPGRGAATRPRSRSSS